MVATFISQPSKNTHHFNDVGKLAILINQFDWHKTSLGAISQWPSTLKNLVNFILYSSLPMFIVWGKEQSFIYNDACIVLLRSIKHPWALGKPFKEVCSESWVICKDEAERVMQQRKPSMVNNILLFMPRDGHLEEAYFSFSFSPIIDEEDKTNGVFCTAMDMTNHLINTRRLKMLEKLSAQAVIRKNIRSACTSVSKALAENPHDIPFAILYLREGKKQLTLYDVVGIDKNLAQLAPASVDYGKKIKTKCVWPVEEVMNSRESMIFDTTALDGLPKGQADQKVTEAILLPIILIGEINPIGVLILGMNPCRKLESTSPHFYEWIGRKIAIALQNAKVYEFEKQRVEEFEDAISARDQFISIASHELKTPITSLKLHIQMAKRKILTTKMPDEAIEKLGAMLDLSIEQINRLTDLIDDLLDIAKIRAGRFDLQLTEVSLKGLNEKIIKRFMDDFESQKMSVDCQIEDSIIGFWDEFRLEQVIVNLLSNAIKYAPNSPIFIKAQSKNGWVRYSIQDLGPGIPKAMQELIFKRFERATNAKSIHGLGLGLFIVQKIIHNHGGTITVESNEGQGCTFIITLPLMTNLKGC